jgi:hypothetical protein
MKRCHVCGKGLPCAGISHAAALMVSDPPYGVEYDPIWRERAGLARQRQTGAVANDHRVDWTDAYQLFTGDAAYVWHAGVHAGEVAAGVESVGLPIRAQIIWAKQHFALGRGDYYWQHEPLVRRAREQVLPLVRRPHPVNAVAHCQPESAQIVSLFVESRR